jgi:5-methylcytosine-specific restriction protein A
MPRRRQPFEISRATHQRIWWRDGAQCVRCNVEAIPNVWPSNRVHTDHIVSGRLGSNADSNLRTLCQYHHVLRLDPRHRGMIAGALRQGLIPPHWRELLWE